MRARIILYSFLMTFIIASFGQPNNKRLDELIAHAKQSPRVKTDYKKITDHLVTKATNDLEKAKLIYLWLCFNIDYDARNYFKGKFPDTDPLVTMTNRKAVCSGYSNLFKVMGEHAGLVVSHVSGYSKGYGYRPGTQFKRTDHAWNVVQVEGQKIIVDATWGAGYLKKKKYVQKLNMYWFNTNPYEAVLSHLPEKDEYQLIKPKLTLEQFSKLPKVRATFFELGLLDAKKVISDFKKGIELNIPHTYTIDVDFDIIKAPIKLVKGKTYHFECASVEGGQLAVITKDDFFRVDKNAENIYSFDYTPLKKGDLKISIQYPGKESTSYHTALKYKVKK